MKETYKNKKLDCLLTLGGNGTHKTANLLSSEGLNVIGLPKTIDNDIWGTSVTLWIPYCRRYSNRRVIDRLSYYYRQFSYGRILVVEIMESQRLANTYSGAASGADP